jgi:hypothetical protein
MLHVERRVTSFGTRQKIGRAMAISILRQIYNSGPRWRGPVLGVFAVAALLVGLDQLAATRAQAKLQIAAERAALAGVKALRDNGDESDARRREIAAEASRAAAGDRDAEVVVLASVTPMVVAVEVSKPTLLQHLHGRLAAVGKAGYLPPQGSGEGQSAQLYNRLDWPTQTASAAKTR